MHTTPSNRTKRFAAAATVAAAVTLAGVGAVRAATPSSSEPVEPDEFPRMITVSGTGTVTAETDRAIVQLGVASSERTGAEAMSEATQASNAVIEALTTAGVALDDITTTSVQLYERYDEDGEDIIAYDASIRLNVTVDGVDEDATMVGQVIDAAQGAGGDGFTVDGVMFTFADPDALRDEARLAAGEDARRAAELIAHGTGAAVGDVLTINQSEYYMPPPMYDAAYDGDVMAAPAAGAPTTVAPTVVLGGELDFSVTVTATFELA